MRRDCRIGRRACIGIVCVLLCAGMAGQAQNREEAMFDRSLVDTGNTARLQRALARARRGDKVTVAVIGGSITQGAAATVPDRRYGDRIARWWREQFPAARIEFVNAGIGATGSNYGTLRARRDLLPHKPDFVVVEYGVNDPNSQESAETLEGLVRQILKQPQKPAVVLLFMMNQGGGNAQEWHSKVGRHYGLPLVSFRDALWPEIDAGRMKWEEVMADVVHPNDRGHEYAARFVTHLLEKALAALPPDSRLPKIAVLPKPLLTDLFEQTALYEAPDMKPLRNEGWTLDTAGKCWRADRPGSVIEFEVEGRLLYALFWRIRGPMGRALVRVDNGPAVTLEGWFDQTWGGYQPVEVIARNLSPGRHRVRIELSAERHPESSGNEFKLFSLGAAGIRR